MNPRHFYRREDPSKFPQDFGGVTVTMFIWLVNVRNSGVLCFIIVIKQSRFDSDLGIKITFKLPHTRISGKK